MKKRNIILGALAMGLVTAAGMGSAMAYFTTYAQAQGGYTVELGARTELREEFEGGTKHLSIANNADSDEDVFIRAKADNSTEYPGLSLTYQGEGWSDGGDGWWYYGAPVAPGGKTQELLVSINGIPHKADAPQLEEGDTFDVVVLYEYTRALYHEDGSAYADWNRVLDNGEGGGDR